MSSSSLFNSASVRILKSSELELSSSITSDSLPSINSISLLPPPPAFLAIMIIIIPTANVPPNIAHLCFFNHVHQSSFSIEFSLIYNKVLVKKSMGLNIRIIKKLIYDIYFFNFNTFFIIFFVL
jgi:hypothetical protein